MQPIYVKRGNTDESLWASSWGASLGEI